MPDSMSSPACLFPDKTIAGSPSRVHVTDVSRVEKGFPSGSTAGQFDPALGPPAKGRRLFPDEEIQRHRRPENCRPRFGPPVDRKRESRKSGKTPSPTKQTGHRSRPRLQQPQITGFPTSRQ
ncbi:unnamed protein product [Calypogeia fissa]